MSLPPQQKASAKRTGKRISFFNDQGVAMKEPVQQAEGPYFNLGPSGAEQRPSEAGGMPAPSSEGPNMYFNSVIFSPDKGEQSRGHYQQTVPMKWTHQEPPQQSGWPQGIAIPSWTHSFPQYLSGVGVGVGINEARVGQAAFLKPISEKQLANPADRDEGKARSLDWEQQQQQQQQQTVVAMQHAQVQAYQQGQKPGALQSQPHAASHATPSSVLQPFQIAFGQPKQSLSSDYFQVFQNNRTLPNMNYGAQPKAQHQLQMQQQQQHQQQQLQQQQQQRHLHQQQLQQQQQLHQQQQQQQLQQQMQHQQSPQQIQHQNQHFAEFFPGTHLLHANPHLQQPPPSALGPQAQPQGPQAQPQGPQAQPQGPQAQPQGTQAQPQGPQAQPQGPQAQPQGPSIQLPLDPQEPDPQKLTSGPQQAPEAPQPIPRRSRRLSKEGGVPPTGDNPFLVPLAQPGQGSQNGGPEGRGASMNEDMQAAPTGGVIQSTRRKRRASQEVNLETLAQKASEMESLPPQVVKHEPEQMWVSIPSAAQSVPGRGALEREGAGAKRPRDESLLPLVIPVSVPVRRHDHPSPEREQEDLPEGWPQRPPGLQGPMQPEHKPSVIVTRRRSLRNSLSESSGLNGGGGEGGKDDSGKSVKSKRRPRPEPLFIPPPKPGTFIAPSVYSNITPYQSHLRSPVRLADNPLTMPPYTPPPILSPVREGSGLYFSTFLSPAAAAAATANSQGMPPLATPKSATRSLLRSNSCDITPPVLSAMNEVTPVSIEPRINIGPRYQAEIPDLRDRQAAQQDQHLAEVVWVPLQEPGSKPAQQERVNDLMSLACSSALCGGGTNQELALHCLYECKGDILGALALLLLKTPIFSKTHPLGDYHYSGSDSWTLSEKRYFNKGITAYKKDFFMVQKLVRTKTVAQCVEFYYTYKKQVKIGRNGSLIYGDMEPLETRAAEVEVDVKSSQRFETRKEEDSDRKWEGPCDGKRGSSPPRVTQMLQATENVGAVLLLKEEPRRDQQFRGVSLPPHPHLHPHPHPHPPSAPAKPRPETAGKKSVTSAVAKAPAPAGQEGEFPCKKCGRVFSKVKSRSAHMKSHAEQEKKAAALRQKEAEERAAAAAAAAAVEAARQNGAKEQAEDSSDESSVEGEDADDEDWH